MHRVASAFSPIDTDWHPRDFDEAMLLFDRFRRAGCDLKLWAFARYMIWLGGPVAEAMFLKRDVWHVVEEQLESGDDVPGLRRDMCLLKRRYISATMMKLSAWHLKWVFSQADAWKTIVAIAKCLRRGEVTPGAEIVRIINENLRELRLFDFSTMPQVRIRRDPVSNSVATCLLNDLDDWRFSSVSGGRQVRTNKEFLYAKIWCSELIDGSIGHSCIHGDGPHEILVCVLPEDNKEGWNEITREAAWGLHHAAGN
jgi:hypothetical protein